MGEMSSFEQSTCVTSRSGNTLDEVERSPAIVGKHDAYASPSRRAGARSTLLMPTVPERLERALEPQGFDAGTGVDTRWGARRASGCSTTPGRSANTSLGMAKEVVKGSASSNASVMAPCSKTG